MIPALLPVGIAALIFGGCCSNVFALETIVKEQSNTGLLITLFQFLFTTLATYPSQFSQEGRYYLRPSTVPFRKWAVSAAMFFAVNMLNNWAFAFDISVPVHIILRSFGSVTTMGAGWLRGKKYTPIQVFSVALLTVGVLISAWADAQSKGKSMSTDKDVETRTFTSTSLETGLVVLLIAQLLSAWMGAYVEDIYREHGKHWDENLFYSHFLSLPMFLPLQDTLRDQYKGLAGSRSLIISPGVSSYLPEALQKILSSTPRGVFMLMLNATTQLLCISGVNLLSANSSAVTVTIVLNIRKLVSFMFSIWLFGNKMSGQMLLGAVIVFGAGALYGWETSVGIKQRKAKAEQVGKKQQ